ncbi:hypothetical protein GF340_00775 [Candidatus Peregrinibacteria bacterium]|nr:hypothetical protein [Candidatus Peregrinibacteria bacterium]
MDALPLEYIPVQKKLVAYIDGANMDAKNDTLNEIKKNWWLHDSFWHAEVYRSLGHEVANKLNHRVNERLFRMITLIFIRKRLFSKPNSIRDLMEIFKLIWKECFFDELYLHDPITFKNDTAVWIGSKCQAYESLIKAGMVSNYQCGCEALRNGVMKALKLEPLHIIRESFVKGDKRCVVEVKFNPLKNNMFD